MNLYRQTQFLLSAQQLKHLPEDSGFEIAFAGRSNSGKSSAINTIVDQKSLARTSKTPGRTQQLVLFSVDAQRRLVDLPGYGYAKVPLAMKLDWQKTLAQYLQTRQCLCGLVLIMDIRHPLTEFDLQMLTWCESVKMPVHILLSKADKLSYGKGLTVLAEVKQRLVQFENAITIQRFSSLKHEGVAEVQIFLNQRFQLNDTTSLQNQSLS